MEIFRRKPKFFYKVSDNYYFKDKDIFDPYELVEHIKNEDYRFRQEYLQETITISKIRNDKYQDIYYAKRIHLPQEEDFDWFDELTGFFAKKPQEYTLEDSTDSESSTEENKTLTLEEFESDLQAEPEHGSEIPETPKDEILEQEINELNTGSVTEEKEFIKVSKDEYLSLQLEIEQLKNIARLEKGLEEEREEQTNFTAVDVVDPLSKNMDQLLDNTYKDEIVENVLRMTKHEMDQQLSQFVTSETAKIQAEIQQLDKRNMIEETITKRIESEREDQLAKLNIQMTNERDQEIHEENLRHETRLDEIANTYNQKLIEETAKIKEKLKEKLETSIKEEYEQQSEQLSRILQGKMDELKLRQQAVNAGLEANFKEALENFNYQHKLVIQEVEQKKQSSPINLEEIRKLKQA
ncbi:hypothetical protein ACJQ40_002745 [Enterococcus faecium]